MSIKGVLTQLNHSLPAGLDGGVMMNWRLRDGRTYDQVRADIAAALDGLNARLLNGWGDLVYVTQEDAIEYPSGSGESERFYPVSDESRVQLFKGGAAGHMIPMQAWGRGIGGTHRFFRDARASVLTATIRDLVNAGINTFEIAVLTRMFNDAEVLIGTTGYDVGMVSGSASVPFAPPSYGGEDFTNAHEHYMFFDSDGAADQDGFDDMLEALAENVTEHGHMGQLVALVSETDVASYMALPNFVKTIGATGNGNITVIGGTSAINYFTAQPMEQNPRSSGRFFGYYLSGRGTIEMRATRRIPTGYAMVYVSGGVNNPANPWYVRTHPAVGFGFYIAEVPSYQTTFPVAEVDVFNEFGVGAGMDRTKAAVGRRATSGGYVAPTIS